MQNMPFTLTHIAAVVPIKKLTGIWLPLTALAIGSMVSDMPIFFGLPASYSTTHSLFGIITACLPIGIALYLVFQILVRTALLEIMPNAISTRLGERTRHDLKYLIGIVAALIIGAGTHVLWDSFTHRSGWGVQLVPALRESFVLFNRPHRIYTLLQHGSSVIFLPLMAYGLYRWSKVPFVLPPRPYRSQLHLPLWIKLTGCFAIFIAPALWALTEAWLKTHSFYYGIGLAARAYGRYMVLTVLGFSLLIRAAIWLRARNEPRRT